MFAALIIRLKGRRPIRKALLSGGLIDVSAASVMRAGILLL